MWLKPKLQAELTWQNRWARELAEHDPDWAKSKAYWEEYRYLDILRTLDIERALDVGSGISTGLRFLDCETAIAMDPLMPWYQNLCDYPGIESIRGDGEDIPYDDGLFDLVLCTNVLDHTRDPVRVMDEILRVTAPNGHIMVSVDVWGEANTEIRDPAHPHRMTLGDVQSFTESVTTRRFQSTKRKGVREYVLGMDGPQDGAMVCGLFRKGTE